MPAPSRRAAQKARRTPPRPNHRPPRILDGYQRTKGTWTARSPAQVVLTALATGATMEIAARVAGVTEDTVRRWDSRGAEIAAGLDETEADLAASEPDEIHAYLRFHHAAQHAKVQMVSNALGVLNHAQSEGNLNAAEIVLKRHPEARQYRPAETHEVTGKDGDALTLSVDVKAEARAVLESMVERIAANTRPETPAEDAAP
jgi:hypothetical protein